MTKSLSADNRVLWMLADMLGSVRDIVDNAGNGISHVSYDAYGNITGGTGVLLTRYLWTGANSIRSLACNTTETAGTIRLGRMAE